jgi:peptidoglycan-associated lipoprotein
MKRSTWFPILALALTLVVVGCSKKPPVAAAPPPPGDMPAAFPSTNTDADGPVRPPDPPPIPIDSGITSSPLDSWDSKSIDAINSAADSPLRPVFFLFDSDEVSEEAKKILAANAEVLRTYPTWVVTIEGHSDERGTAEYNLALGDRRALAARTYLLSLGIAAQRLRTVSYGKEFPFDPGHDEAAWSKNRRAHFMLTAK